MSGLSQIGGWLQKKSDVPVLGDASDPGVLKPVILHGDLDFWILEARSLPNLDLASHNLARGFTKYVNTSDPYVSVYIAGATIARTRVISNCENPQWHEHFCVPIAHPAEIVEFHVKDNDDVGAELIGIVAISAEEILTGNVMSGWFPILGTCKNSLRTSPELHLCLQFKPVTKNPRYQTGVSSEGDFLGVPNTYFPLRKGCHITLYQDAHVPDGMLPDVPLEDDELFKQCKCWEDICHAILEARHLIYIIGWSVYHKVKLVREPTRVLPSAGKLSLGDLLKHKSQEGARVILLVWDDKTSNDDFFLKTEGIMQTHDEETKKFFKRSSVHCLLCPRSASSKLSVINQTVVGNLFTHHQKCVILDSEGPEGSRKITAFIGGLDLCDGRYDTPHHRLFDDLDTVFHDDFHNPTFLNVQSRKCTPRQPWHDLHCKIEGPAAYDVLTNFEQRYRKASKWANLKGKARQWHDDTLLKLDQISWIQSPSGPAGYCSLQVTDEEDPRSWHVQIFRSIDSGSVKGFPKDVVKAEAQNLLGGKSLIIDKSIHTAYIHAIRSAQQFIYIENQYFIGSSYMWGSYKSAGADNLVPMEIALKIASKILANEPFSVYVIIPMWPEGIPTTAAVQEILYWQSQTMTMMYKVVAEALESAGLLDSHHPQDYLNFYCLGKREAALSDITNADQPPSNSLGSAQKFRRFMIYVHSKGMVVDDEYILMGSANINQRSLDGSRDTEIAMGAYQPHFTWIKKESHPHGQVYGYRMSLWAEHLGILENCFEEPQTMQCIRRVNEIAMQNWNAFMADEFEEMRGHLMQYPVQVSKEGEVSILPGFKHFPDVGGKILGAPTSLPDALTT